MFWRLCVEFFVRHCVMRACVRVSVVASSLIGLTTRLHCVGSKSFHTLLRETVLSTVFCCVIVSFFLVSYDEYHMTHVNDSNIGNKWQQSKTWHYDSIMRAITSTTYNCSTVQ